MLGTATTSPIANGWLRDLLAVSEFGCSGGLRPPKTALTERRYNFIILKLGQRRFIAALDGIAELTFILAMTVTLTAEQEQFIAEQLKGGHYRSASDVIAQSLGMLRAQEEFIRSNAAELREKIAVGIGQANRGELLDGYTVIDGLLEKNRRRTRIRP